MKHYIILFCVIFIFLSPAAAQTGCLVNTDDVYLDKKRIGLLGSLVDILFGSKTIYNENGAIDPRETACVAGSKNLYSTSNPINNCMVCPQGVALGGLLGTTILGCVNNVELNGTLVTRSVVACNLDDYSWTLGAAAGLLGVFVIRRRNKL
ncbi:hypothetical protein QFZ20_002994 [Flavobacterium sp. W4I14]|nr:hypothetical protein [Flavobacterium sp. W4I14]